MLPLWDEIDWDKDNGVFINKVKLSKLLLATREREAVNEETSNNDSCCCSDGTECGVHSPG